MFARVQTIHDGPEKLDELAEIARKQLPTAHNLPGFQGLYYLVDHDNGKALVISLWETEENLRQLLAHHEVRQQVEAEAAIISPPSEIFEVAVQAL